MEGGISNVLVNGKKTDSFEIKKITRTRRHSITATV